MLTERRFSSLDMMDITSVGLNEYFRPTFPTLTAVESFALMHKKVLFPGEEGTCIVGFQATVAKNHPVKRAGLQKIRARVKELGHDLDLVVVFVVGQGDEISERQKLGERVERGDDKFRQCVLYGLAGWDGALLQGAAKDDEEGGE